MCVFATSEASCVQAADVGERCEPHRHQTHRCQPRVEFFIAASSAHDQWSGIGFAWRLRRTALVTDGSVELLKTQPSVRRNSSQVNLSFMSLSSFVNQRVWQQWVQLWPNVSSRQCWVLVPIPSRVWHIRAQWTHLFTHICLELHWAHSSVEGHTWCCQVKRQCVQSFQASHVPCKRNGHISCKTAAVELFFLTEWEWVRESEWERVRVWVWVRVWVKVWEWEWVWECESECESESESVSVSVGEWVWVSVSEWVRVSEREWVWVSVWVWVRVRVSECEWVWVSEWVGEWVSEWVSEKGFN